MKRELQCRSPKKSVSRLNTSRLIFVSCIFMPFLKNDKRPYHYWKLLSQNNSSMTDLSMWLLSDILHITSLASPLRHKHVTTKLPNGFLDLHPMMFSFIVSTMYFISSSLTYGPAGRHIPTLNKASDTPLT